MQTKHEPSIQQADGEINEAPPNGNNIRPLMSMDIPRFVRPRFGQNQKNRDGWQTAKQHQPNNTGRPGNKPPYPQRKREDGNNMGQQRLGKGPARKNTMPPQNQQQPAFQRGPQNRRNNQQLNQPQANALYPPAWPQLQPNMYHQNQIAQGHLNPVPIYCNPSETALLMTIHAQNQGYNMNQSNNAPATITYAQMAERDNMQ